MIPYRLHGACTLTFLRRIGCRERFDEAVDINDFQGPDKKGGGMLHYAVVFFIIAIVAAVFGFGGIAAGAAGIAKILFVVFLIGAIVALLFGRTECSGKNSVRYSTAFIGETKWI